MVGEPSESVLPIKRMNNIHVNIQPEIKFLNLLKTKFVLVHDMKV